MRDKKVASIADDRGVGTEDALICVRSEMLA